MNRDFTLEIYQLLLEKIQQHGYKIIAYEDYLLTPQPKKIVIMRHDVDTTPINSYLCAEIEKEMRARSTYYFRIVKESNEPDIIRRIAACGHEIGYHYEDLTLADGNVEKAFELFKKHLAYFREFYPVKTICMHGSPMSPYDNRRLWSSYSYREHGIIGEPYFDIDFNTFLYLTDTGRRWNGDKVSVRDKVKNPFKFNFRGTQDVINALDEQLLPDQIMITTHPQRWHIEILPWMHEYITQNLKNVVKKYLYVNNDM